MLLNLKVDSERIGGKHRSEVAQSHDVVQSHLGEEAAKDSL